MTSTAMVDVNGEDGATVSLVRGGEVLTEPSTAVCVEVDGRTCARLVDGEVRVALGCARLVGLLEGTSVRIEWSATRLGGRDSWELRLRLHNAGAKSVRITRMDPLALRLGDFVWTALYFRSAWGEEFQPVEGRSDEPLRLGSRAGRSSHGMSPWLGLERDGVGLVVAPAWSGNWHIDVDERDRVTAGISPWLFETVLGAGESVDAPSVVLATGDDIDDAAGELTRSLAVDWIPRSHASQRLDVEWNHWWPYEDVEVSEEVILRNADVAAEIGIDTVTVDAGWFGVPDDSVRWPHQRGDWHLVNRERFPHGLEGLGDGIRTRRLRAGIWIEAEAVSAGSELRRSRPDILAVAIGDRLVDDSYRHRNSGLDAADPEFLGYVCLGSPEGREFVGRALDRVVTDIGAEWLKLDFNLDPDGGCSRTDHGHGAHDGLLRHYQGLYDILDRFRENHPDVVLEACASGGLRHDIGLARHVHCMFLSDPDYTEHHLQVLWGASLSLPAAALLHWSWSQWREDLPGQRLDFASLGRQEFETTLRAAMLHRFGVSLRLPELRSDLLEALREHIRIYRETLGPIVRDGVLRRLTPQPLRGGRGERCPAFQLDAGERHAVAQFRLAGGLTPLTVRLRGLQPQSEYRVTDLSSGSSRETRGADLMETGIVLDDREQTESSWLFLVEQAHGPDSASHSLDPDRADAE